MATKIIKLNNGTDTYAPVTLANAVQFNTGDTPISVQEAIFSLVQMIFNVAENIPTTDDIPTMTAATASAAGTKGFVPDPPAGSQNKVLTGAATFKTISAFQDAHATGLLYKTMNTTEEFTLFDDTKFTGSPVSLATIASPAISVLLIKDHDLVFYGELVDPSQALPTISLDGTTNTPTLEEVNNLFYLDSWSNAAPTSMSFGNKSNIKSIKKMQIDTSNVTGMTNMFNDCSKLTSLDLSSFNTSNVTFMGYMFRGCRSITSLDLSNFNTSKVTNMSNMFDGCSSLTSLDLSNFDTSNVTIMDSMFGDCSSLTSLNLSNFNTSNVTSMRHMFNYCSKLTTLDLSNFDTSKVITMYNMFYFCKSLTSLDLSNFNTSKVTTMYNMFYFCKSLTSLDLSSFNTSNVTNMTGMFQHCSSLTSLNLSNWDTSKVTDLDAMFNGCSSLKDVYITVEATLNKLTNNLTSQGGIYSNYIPSSATIHYNGVDYKWQNNAWKPQS